MTLVTYGLISKVMYDSITKGSYAFKTASTMYLGFARERVKGSCDGFSGPA